MNPAAGVVGDGQPAACSWTHLGSLVLVSSLHSVTGRACRAPTADTHPRRRSGPGVTLPARSPGPMHIHTPPPLDPMHQPARQQGCPAHRRLLQPGKRNLATAGAVRSCQMYFDAARLGREGRKFAASAAIGDSVVQIRFQCPFLARQGCRPWWMDSEEIVSGETERGTALMPEQGTYLRGRVVGRNQKERLRSRSSTAASVNGCPMFQDKRRT